MHPLNSFLLELLVEHRFLSSEHAEVHATAIAHELRGNERERALYERIVSESSILESELLQFVAEIEGIESDSSDDLLEGKDIDDLKALLDSSIIREYRCVPVGVENNQVTLASEYPPNYDHLEHIAHKMNRDVDVQLVKASALEDAMNRISGGDSHSETDSNTTSSNRASIGQFEELVNSNSDHANGLSEDEVDEGTVSRYVDWVVHEAIKRRASDIHFEPMEQIFRIRCRVDGVLQQLDSPAKQLQSAILSRLKLMSHLDIAEKRLPQDGRFHLVLEERHYDFRVSTVPSTHGEGIVIRILDKDRLSIGLPELGMLPDHQKAFQNVISAPDGIFLVTGPTGSGKSTTLYAALNHINDPSVKILTVEDPVEYHIEGINQVQVRNEVDMTFSAALRSMLRQAPNIIMVGEIRDKETAEIAINASLTGHTVFSTLHTNDAPSAITRLMDMGAKPFLVAAALRAVLAQRLVRKIPAEARIPYPISDWQIKALGEGYSHLAGQNFYHAGQDQQSFHGRLGVFEMFEVDEKLGEIIYQDGSLTQIRSYLSQCGFKGMRHDGIMKALNGVTTIEEVMAVTVADEIS